jgi:hypothetical protein
MNFDAKIVSLVRQGPGPVPLHQLCLLIFPTFSWVQLSPFVALVRWRCHELVREGRLLEVAADCFLPARRLPRPVYQA